MDTLVEGDALSALNRKYRMAPATTTPMITLVRLRGGCARARVCVGGGVRSAVSAASAHAPRTATHSSELRTVNSSSASLTVWLKKVVEKMEF